MSPQFPAPVCFGRACLGLVCLGRACLGRACLGLAALLLVACSSSGRAPAGTGVRRAMPGGSAPAFSGMRSALLAGAAARERGDAPALRALGPSISRTGLALLEARMPHDLRRADVERFVDARAAFGDALKLWVGAVSTPSGTAPSGTAPDDAAVLGAYDGLVETYWAWVDVYRGLAPERAV